VERTRARGLGLAVLMTGALAGCGGASPPVTASRAASSSPAPSSAPTTTTSTTTTTFPPALPSVSATFLRPGWGIVALFNAPTPSGALLEMTTDFVHWRNITPPVPGPDQYGDTFSISDISFPTADCGWVVVGTPGILFLYRTTDGGSTWQNLGNTGQGGSAGEELVTFTDALHGWRQVIAPTAGQNRYSVTSDGGETWTAIDTPGPWPESGLLTFSSASHGFSADSLPPSNALVTNLPVSAFSPLWETTDGGSTWHRDDPTSPPGQGATQAFVGLPTFFGPDQGVLPLASFGTGTTVVFYGTPDGGSTWSVEGSVVTTANPGSDRYGNSTGWPSVAESSDDTWWVVGGVTAGSAPTVRVSADAGRYWTDIIPTGLPPDLDSFQAARPGPGPWRR
jgi:hypothetical protein